ncbi:MAG: DUF460 domain-containing protein [Candidatus Bathyarchaeia archaeon]
MYGSLGKALAVVGVDPGMTLGVAALDLSMNPIYVRSFKPVVLEAAVRELSGKCRPILIASDVREAPEAVKKIAAMFDAGLFTPKRNLSVQEKGEILEEYLKDRPHLRSILDEHSSDALSSALKAFKSFKNRFQKIDEFFNFLSSRDFQDRVKADVLRGCSLNRALRRALLEEASSLEDDSRPMVVKMDVGEELRNIRRRMLEGEEALRKLQMENLKLRSRLKEALAESEKLRSSQAEWRRDFSERLLKDSAYMNQVREIQALRKRLQLAEAKVESLTSTLKRLDKIREVGKAGDLILLKPIQHFTEEGVEDAIRRMGIKPGDPLFILNAAGGGPSTAKRLVELRPKFIILGTGMSHNAEDVLTGNGIPLLSLREVEVKYIDDMPAVSRKAVWENLRSRGLDSNLL